MCRRPRQIRPLLCIPLVCPRSFHFGMSPVSVVGPVGWCPINDYSMITQYFISLGVLVVGRFVVLTVACAREVKASRLHPHEMTCYRETQCVHTHCVVPSGCGRCICVVAHCDATTPDLWMAYIFSICVQELQRVALLVARYVCHHSGNAAVVILWQVNPQWPYREWRIEHFFTPPTVSR